MLATHSVAAPEAPVKAPVDEVRHRRWTRATAPIIGAALGAGLFAVGFRGIIDDGHITMAYAQNLAEHAHWGLTRYGTSNTATSPLNVWAIALGILLTGSGTLGVGLVLVASTASTAGWLSAIARRTGLPPVATPTVAVSLLVSSPLFASTLGMETFLSIAVLVGVARYSLAGDRVRTGVLCGLAVLARPDLAVPAALLAVVLLVANAEQKARAAGVVAAVAAATALLWHLPAWVALGGFVPDTYAIKSAAGAFAGGDTFLTGPIGMARTWTHAAVLIAVPVLVALAAAARWAAHRPSRSPAGRVAAAFVVAGLGHWAAYVAVGVPPYHWYYCPAVGLLSVAAAVTVCALPRRCGATTMAVLFVGVSVGYQVAGPVPWVQPVVYGNWGTPAQYAAMARGVDEQVPDGAAVEGFGEVGAVGYHCRCQVVGDPLADRSAAQRSIRDRYTTAGPVGRWLLDVNYAFADRDPPATRADYRIVYSAGPGPGWRVDGPGTGQGHVRLVATGP